MAQSKITAKALEPNEPAPLFGACQDFYAVRSGKKPFTIRTTIFRYGFNTFSKWNLDRRGILANSNSLLHLWFHIKSIL